MAAFELKPYANVAAGGAHSLVCAGPKKIMSFGNGRYGQLGTGRTIQFDNPYQVDKGEENSDRIMWDDAEHSVVHVVCGNNHSAALTDKGRLYMWGRNNKDQLGIPKPLDAAQAKNTWMPCLVDITHNHTTCSILHVTCGVNFTAAVDMDANVFTWGLGTFGNLGHGDTRDRATPTFVEALEGKSIVMLAAGAKHVLAVTRFGDLYSWGHSGNGRLGLEDEAEGGAEEEGHIGHLHPRRVHGIRKGTRYVVAGEAHSVAVSHEGRLYTWGAGSYGRLGHGFDTDESVPKIVENLHDQIKMAACGVFHTVVLTKSGRVWVFGGGQYGQLGLGDDTSNRSLPEELQQRVHAFGGYDVLQVASGDFHCICLAVSRDLGGAPVVMTWGFGAFGRLGQGRDKLGICTTPHKVEGLSVNVGGALRAGDGGASAPESAAQSRELLILQMYTQTIVQQISCGAQHSGAVTKNGRLYMWGCNDFGQIGDGECPRATLTPTESTVRKKLLNSFVTHLACGHEHTLALTYEKQLFAWGRGSEYQLGISHNDEKNPVPVLVQALFGVDVIDVQAGEAHSAAILETGALYTWGAGDLGKLGHGRDIDGRLPRRVKGELLAHRVRKCSLGMNHTVALTDHGEIFTWGAGWFGRLGTGATNNEYEPKRVRGVLEGRTATAVAAGAYHTLAICDGDLYVWGRNEKRLGIGDSPSELLLPKRNEMLRALGEDISGCAAGEEHSIVFTKLGSVYSWGTGVYCKLGHVNRSHVRAPQKDEVGADDQAESSGKLHEAASLQMDADAPGAVMLIPETEDGVSTKKLLLEEWDGEGFPSRSDVRAVATYSNHCIALTLSGHVYVWGCAGSGRLGVELREKQGGIQPQAVRVMCDEWKDESVSVSGHHGRGGAAGDGHSATKVHSLSDRDGGGGGGGAGDVEIGVMSVDRTKYKKGDADVEDLIKHLQHLMQNEPARQKSDRLQRQQQNNRRDRRKLINDGFVRKIQPHQKQAKDLRDKIAMVIKSTLRSMYPNSTKFVNPDRVTARYTRAQGTFVHIFNAMSAHPLIVDEMHKCIFGSRVLLAVSEGQRVDEVDESTHTLQNYEDFKELVVAVFGGMVDPRMENLFLKLLELILRREMRAYVDASQSAAVDGGDSAGAAASASPGESATDGGGGGSRAYNVKNFGDEKSVFGRLVYAYFRSHAVMGHLVVTMARPLKEFLKKDVDLDTNPIAVWNSMDVGHQMASSANAAKIYDKKPEVQQEVNRRVDALVQHASDWVHKLIASLTEAPRGLRFVCKAIHHAVHDFHGNRSGVRSTTEVDDEARMLIGKFLVLHYFRPAIQFPKQFGVLKRTFVLTKRHQMNLRKIMQVVFRCLTNKKYVTSGTKNYLSKLNSCIEGQVSKCREAIGQLIELPADYLDRRLMKDMFTLHLRLDPLRTTVAVSTLRYLVSILRQMQHALKVYSYISVAIDDLETKFKWCEASEDELRGGQRTSGGRKLRPGEGARAGVATKALSYSRLNLELNHTFGELPVENPVICQKCKVPLAERIKPPFSFRRPPINVDDLAFADVNTNAFKTVLCDMPKFTVPRLDHTILAHMLAERLEQEKDADDLDKARRTHRALIKLRSVKGDVNGFRRLLQKLMARYEKREMVDHMLQTEERNIDDLKRHLQETSTQLDTRLEELKRYYALLQKGTTNTENRIQAHRMAMAENETLEDDKLVHKAHSSKSNKKLLKDDRLERLSKKQETSGAFGTFKFRDLRKPGEEVVQSFTDPTMKLVAAHIRYQFSSIRSGVYHVSVTYRDTMVLDSFDISIAELNHMQQRLEEEFTPDASGTSESGEVVKSKTTFNTTALLDFMTRHLVIAELFVGLAS